MMFGPNFNAGHYNHLKGIVDVTRGGAGGRCPPRPPGVYRFSRWIEPEEAEQRA